jgi:hypothetical protein
MMYKVKGLCLSSQPHKTHKYNVIRMQNFRMLNLVVCIVTGRLLKVNTIELLSFIELQLTSVQNTCIIHLNYCMQTPLFMKCRTL